MRCSVLGMACAVVLSVSASPGVTAPDKTLAHCQKLKDQIERYDALRRQGGSGAKMDNWKRARRQHEKRFRAEGCHYHRHELR